MRVGPCAVHIQHCPTVKDFRLVFFKLKRNTVLYLFIELKMVKGNPSSRQKQCSYILHLTDLIIWKLKRKMSEQ